MNFYLVMAKCGHVGKKMYIPITFPIKAESGGEAATQVRSFPRVKHHHKDAIINVKRVSEEEYDKQLEINNNDLYLQAKNIQDQKLIEGLESRFCIDDCNCSEKNERPSSKLYKLKKQKIIKNSLYKEIQNYYFENIKVG